MKKVVIFGATGNTGLCATEHAVKKGLQVRAFVRDPSKLPDDLKDKVEIFEGNVLEPDCINYAVEGMDGVVILLGTRDCLDQTDDMSEGTRNILESMRAKNVKNVSACMSCFLLYEPDKVPKRFNEINNDHKRMYEALKDSAANWIAVLPPHISKEPSSKIVVEVNPTTSPGRQISKYDLGAFMVDCLDEPKYYKTSIGLANEPQQ